MKTKKPLNNLRKIRKGLGMTQNEFGDMLGFERNNAVIPQSYYRKYENGLLALSAEHAYTILKTFNISFKELLEKE